MEVDLDLVEIKQKPVYGKIVSETQDGAEGVKIDEINRFPADPEHRVAEFVYGSVSLSPIQFKHILEMVTLAQSSQLLTTTIYLSVFGLDLGFGNAEDGWPEKRVLCITNIEFDLQPRRTEEETESGSRGF
jgi:hypothetical protein